MPELVTSFKQLRVYQRSFEASLRIYNLTDTFPGDERFRLTRQIIRSSTSVSANIAEAWRRRRTAAAFADKLNISEAEAAETQHWLAIAERRCYIAADVARVLDEEYEHILSQLVTMINQADRWVVARIE